MIQYHDWGVEVSWQAPADMPSAYNIAVWDGQNVIISWLLPITTLTKSVRGRYLPESETVRIVVSAVRQPPDIGEILVYEEVTWPENEEPDTETVSGSYAPPAIVL